MYATGGKSEILGKFFSVVLEKDGDQSDPKKNIEMLHKVKEERNIYIQ
jgi:hypothetical protein